MNIPKSILYFVFIALFVIQARSQDVLEKYIDEGLNNNLALKQKKLNYRKSLETLQEARGLFFPDISFNARYSIADGGRVFDIPTGDMLNPVYSTLNHLTQTNNFPQIENQEIPFLRPNEQETKLSLRQPIFRPEVFFNFKIRKNMAEVEFIGVEVYKRELVYEIKTAYFNYLKTVKALEVFELTLNVVHENLRVNESLFENDKVTMDVVYRSKAELSKVEQQKAEAEKLHNTSKAYFNFLLNRGLVEPILVMEESNLRQEEWANESEAVNKALSNREELDQVKLYQDIAEKSLMLNRYNMAPTLSGAVDYGIQGERYEFGPDADFVMASLVLEWKLFRGFENRAKIQKAAIEKYILEEKYNELEKQINLYVIDAFYELAAAIEAVVSARTQRESAVKAFDLINKKYNQGQSNLLEFIDARTSATNALLNLILAQYDFEISQAAYERALAIYPID